MGLFRWLGLSGCLVASAANAQLVFSDDFESGALVKPDGRWAALALGPGVSGAWSSAPVHSGAGAFRVTDSTSGGSGGQALLSTAFNAAGSSTLTLSFWFSGGGAQATGVPVAAIKDGVSGDYQAVLQYQLWGGGPRDTLYLSCGRDALTSPTVAVNMMNPNRWYAIDLTVNDIGTANSSCEVAVDGVLQAGGSGFDSTGQSPDTVVIGEDDGDRAFSGTMSFDDVTVRLSGRDGGFMPVAPGDAGAVLDAGTPLTDAGTPLTDAGSDAGVPATGTSDGGNPVTDGGLSVNDAGMPGDAGVEATSSQQALRIGCDCSSGTGALSVWASLAWGLCASARRRRARSSGAGSTSLRLR